MLKMAGGKMVKTLGCDDQLIEPQGHPKNTERRAAGHSSGMLRLIRLNAIHMGWF